MARSRSRSTKPEVEQETQITEEVVTPVETEVETPVESKLEVTPEADKPKEKVSAQDVQTQIKQKLSRRDTEENMFVPSHPADLDKEIGRIAEEQGFSLNRGTTVGARLMARSNQINAQ